MGPRWDVHSPASVILTDRNVVPRQVAVDVGIAGTADVAAFEAAALGEIAAIGPVTEAPRKGTSATAELVLDLAVPDDRARRDRVATRLVARGPAGGPRVTPAG